MLMQVMADRKKQELEAQTGLEKIRSVVVVIY